jgi:hypothetical protein
VRGEGLCVHTAHRTATKGSHSKRKVPILYGMAKPDLTELLALHVQASRRRNELLAECQRLVEAGQRRAARRCLAAAEELQELLTALVREVRRAVSHTTEQPSV